VLIYACDVEGALRIDWLRGTDNVSSIQWWESYFKYERSKGSISQKRERERVVVGFW